VQRLCVGSGDEPLTSKTRIERHFDVVFQRRRAEGEQLSAGDAVGSVIFAICEVDVVLLDHPNINVQLRHRWASAPSESELLNIIKSRRVEHNACRQHLRIIIVLYPASCIIGMD
jgi:hypothetical protein